MKKHIIHFPVSHPYLNYIQTLPAFAGFSFSPYIKNTTNITNELFLLISPFEVKKKFIAPDHIWRQYLKQHHPDTVLFTLGIYPNEHSNYLHLFGLPDDLETKILSALRLNAEWQPFIYEAYDGRSILKDFLEGHGEDSFYKPLYRIQSILADAVQEKLDQVPYQETYTELIVRAELYNWWAKLVFRWKKYQDFFEILPFWVEKSIIDKAIDEMSPFFAKKCQDEKLLYELNCVENFKIIFSTIEKIKAYATH